MTGTYTDEDVARYASHIIHNAYPPEQAGQVSKLIEVLLLKTKIVELNITHRDVTSDQAAEFDIDVSYMKGK